MFHKMRKMDVKFYFGFDQKFRRHGKICLFINFIKVFEGRAFLLKNFNNPILNSFKAIDNVSEISTNTIKTIEEKAFSKENNLSDASINFSSFTFPLNNREYLEATPNYFNDSNLNLFFIEFELNTTNNPQSHVKCLTEINNKFVDKDFQFTINVYF
jgi:hypothetical protein